MRKIKLVIGIVATSLLLVGCGNTKLDNGKELLLEMTGIKMTANNLYDTLKDKYGVATLVDQIDLKLLSKEYETTDDMKKTVEAQILSIKDQTGSDFAQTIRYYYGVTTEAELYDYIEMNLKKTQAIKDYAKTTITDEDINTYYANKAIGDIRASHILIKPDTKTGATEAETTAAENKALEQANDIIAELNAGASFSDLAKKYSTDEGSAKNGGDLGFFNRGNMVAEFEDAAIALEVGKYTTTPVKTTYGYHIILKTDIKEKAKLADIKNSIITTLTDEKVANATNLEGYAMEALRTKYELKIYDAELKIKYDNYMDGLKTKTE